METYRERKQNVYRIYAKSYDDDRRLMLGDHALASRMTFVADALSGVSAVLDLGCGTGDLLCTLGTLVGEDARCIGIDLSPEMLTVAQTKIADCPHTYVAQTDVTQPLPFADDTFDLVASLNLLQEVSAPTLVLEEVRRILKPGGSFRGVAACYAGDNAAEMVHQAIARRHAWYFLPGDEMLSLFQRVFPTGTGYFEPFPRVARTQAAGTPTFPLFTEMIKKVRDLGHNPEDVRMGALFLEGKKASLSD
jgi:ubiquinone/menaquinone biosynthesis C-methylase UbiE